MGYEISMRPASVAFLATMEYPMKSSAMRSAAIPPITYKSNRRDERISPISVLRLSVAIDAISITINITNEQIASEVVTEIF